MKAKGYAYKVVVLLIITNSITNPRAFRVVLVLWPILETLIIRGTQSSMNEGHI